MIQSILQKPRHRSETFILVPAVLGPQHPRLTVSGHVACPSLLPWLTLVRDEDSLPECDYLLEFLCSTFTGARLE